MTVQSKVMVLCSSAGWCKVVVQAQAGERKHKYSMLHDYVSFQNSVNLRGGGTICAMRPSERDVALHLLDVPLS